MKRSKPVRSPATSRATNEAGLCSSSSRQPAKVRVSQTRTPVAASSPPEGHGPAAGPLAHDQPSRSALARRPDNMVFTLHSSLSHLHYSNPNCTMRR